MRSHLKQKDWKSVHCRNGDLTMQLRPEGAMALFLEQFQVYLAEDENSDLLFKHHSTACNTAAPDNSDKSCRTLHFLKISENFLLNDLHKGH